MTQKTRSYLIFLIVFLIVASLWYLYPSIRLWTMSESQKQVLRTTEPQDLISLEKRALNLGLDLKGGMHVVLLVDKSKLKESEKRDAVDRALEIIRNRVDQFGVTEPLIQKQGGDKIVVELPGLQDVERAQALIGQTAQLEFKLLESDENTAAILKKIDEVLAQKEEAPLEEEALFKEEEELETLKKAEEKKKIVEDLFAEEEPESVSDTTDTSSFLEVEEEDYYTERPFTSLLENAGRYYLVPIEDKPKVELFLKDPDVQVVIPEDDEFAWATRTEVIRGIEYQKLYLLKKRMEFSGKYLVDARPIARDQYGKPYVNFKLTKQGGRKFARLTGANIGKPLAITLDGRVESAPEIQSKIRDEGRITMGGGVSFDQAVDLAIVLRAGALPAPVKIIENRIIGPSLGQDSIRKGTTSAIIGFCIVLLFMAIYYKLSGVIADFAVLLNLTFLMAAMAALDATLTLPGIAGIILTVGMSVDANVLIFERIREELRTGKTIRAAIDAGYKRAITAIVDANITTLITAGVLFQFGTGPIKGFAVALSLGVAISLFTAVVITRVIFEIRKGYRTLSI
ncbi:MAG: protein translocase subunit SecD [candidate division Zixibacteria bacterium]|nr:protein translocase subunit SecD [candidate division Zixibacteria bacterium]